MTTRTAAQTTSGETFGPTSVQVTRARLVDYANASGDHNPIHQDEALAKNVGLPDVIAHGMWTMGAAGGVIEEWVGAGDRIIDFGTRFTKPVVVPSDGAEVTYAGTVTSVDEDSKQAVVELTATAAGAAVLGKCIATVQLD